MKTSLPVAAAVAGAVLFGATFGTHSPPPSPAALAASPAPASPTYEDGLRAGYNAAVERFMRGEISPCQEDEAFVVAPDPDPSHGLSWHCVSRWD